MQVTSTSIHNVESIVVLTQSFGGVNPFQTLTVIATDKDGNSAEFVIFNRKHLTLTAPEASEVQSCQA